MRFLAFALLATAAFDWPLPWLDRPGTAALGLACFVLSRSPGALLRSRPAFLPFPVPVDGPMPEVEPVARDLRERVGAYSEEGR